MPESIRNPIAAAPVVLAVEELTREYPAVRALDGVTLGFRRGEVHGLIGENGAGKSTLMKILAGLIQPTSGRVLRDGQIVTIPSPLAAARLGIAMVHQELNLIDELSVADNIFLGRERTFMGGFVRRGETLAAARELLARIGCGVDARARAGALSIAEQQMVEIAKALSCDAEILILDEPTAVLSRREVDLLFALIRRLRERGCTIISISHILPEILELCDRVTVLRDGRLVRTLEPEEARSAREEDLASMMVGREMADHFPALPAPREDVLLRVREVSVPRFAEHVSFEVRAGEIFGLAGLVGAGRTELAEGIAGLRARSAGGIEIAGRVVDIRSPRAAARQGLAYLSEDRKGRALILDMSITANTTIVNLRKYAHPFINARAEEAAAAGHARALNTKFGRLRDRIATLSGGNQQKVALAKWLETTPRVLILDEPTRGVDIGAKEEIYRHIAALAARGMACVLISSELNEILGLCHRVGVMRQGRLVMTIDRADLTEERVLHAAAGVRMETREATAA